LTEDLHGLRFACDRERQREREKERERERDFLVFQVLTAKCRDKRIIFAPSLKNRKKKKEKKLLVGTSCLRVGEAPLRRRSLLIKISKLSFHEVTLSHIEYKG